MKSDAYDALLPAERKVLEELRESAPRELFRFAVEGHIGQATKAETAEIAKLEATTAVEVDGAEIPFRRTNVEQANESDPERRARLEEARLREDTHAVPGLR